MSIRRAPRPQSNFYMLDKRISEDRRLTWAARGLLVFLLGKPDHWEVSVKHLIKETADSAKPLRRDAVYGLLRELEDAGYLERSQGRGQGGSFGSADYVVHESPCTENPDTDEPQPDKPDTDKPDTAQPDTANPTQVSTEGLESIEGSGSIDSQQQDGEPDAAPAADADKPGIAPLDAAFETFWQAGMRKANRKAARKAFEAAAKAADRPVAEFAQFLSDDIARRIAAEQLGFDRMHPTTYLNGERWEDDLPPPPAQTNAKPGRAGFAQPKPAGSYQKKPDNAMPSWAKGGA